MIMCYEPGSFDCLKIVGTLLGGAPHPPCHARYFLFLTPISKSIYVLSIRGLSPDQAGLILCRLRRINTESIPGLSEPRALVPLSSTEYLA